MWVSPLPADPTSKITQQIQRHKTMILTWMLGIPPNNKPPFSTAIGCPHKNANLSVFCQIWQLSNLRLERQICFFPSSAHKTLQNANFKFVAFCQICKKSTNIKFDICRFLSNLTKKPTNLMTNLLVWTPYCFDIVPTRFSNLLWVVVPYESRVETKLNVLSDKP